MKLTKFSLERPVTTIMIFVSLIVMGVIFTKELPMEFLPAEDYPFLWINIPYPGSTPEETEKEIIRPAEEALSMLSGIKKMDSYSGDWGGFVQISFEWGVDIDIKAIEAKEKLDAVRDLMPDDLEKYFVFKFNPQDMPIMQLRIASEKNLLNSYDMLERGLKRRLERIKGVSQVELYGVKKKQVEVNLISGRLKAHNINMRELLEKLRKSNFTLSAGKITDGKKRVLVRPEGKITSFAEIGNLIIKKDGTRLKDVAEVLYTKPEVHEKRHLDRKTAIGVEIKKSSGANTIEVADKVLREIEEIKKLPQMAGVNIYFMDNQAEGIKSSLNELLKSGMIGALLAIFVLYFFLRSSYKTLIVVASVPLSILATAIFMHFIGISLNILSMLGLMLAIGMLVDNGVVAIESIQRTQKEEKNRKKAVIKGVERIVLAITAGTLTTIIVFLPNIVSSKNQIFMWLKHVGIPLVIALIASLLIAQTIVPLLTFLFNFEEKKRKRDRKDLNDKMIDIYGKILNWKLHHHKLSIVIFLLILASVKFPMDRIKSNLFPQQADRRLVLNYHIKGRYTLDKIEKYVNIVEDYLYDNKENFEIDSVYTYYATWRAISIIRLKKGDNVKKEQKDIMAEIAKNMPDVVIASPSFERRSSGGNKDQISINLSGKSSAKLIELSHEVATLLEKMPGIESARSQAEAGDKEITIVVDREKAMRYGFSTMELAGITNTAIRGTQLKKIETDESEVDLILRLRKEERQNLNDLKSLPVFNKLGERMELSAIANFELRKGPRTIRRKDRMTTMGVNLNLNEDKIEDAKKSIKEIMDSYNLPTGYTWGFGSSFNFEDETQSALVFNIILALVLIYIVMSALFESLIFPLAIWSSIIFAIIGVYWFFLVTDTTFSVMAWMGVLILIGVVVNNGIVLIDHIHHLRDLGLARKDAIVRAGKERFRPIMMTAATTVLSLIPLCMVKTQIGGQGPPYFPMARAIVGGLTFSTVVTLLILPTIYVILDDLRNWGRKVIGKAVG